MARALANNPRILLMDEPFGALDHQTRELMQELLLGIWEAERKTVLFVTHDIDEAIFMGSRVVVMSARPGRIKCDLPVPIAAPAPLFGEDHAGVHGPQGPTDRRNPHRGAEGVCKNRQCCVRRYENHSKSSIGASHHRAPPCGPSA
jgi:energy-coupling factor transporter ATP-binding protein EcfA2